MRRRPKADDLGSERDRAVVSIQGDMLQRDLNRHTRDTAFRPRFHTQKTAQMRCKIQAASGKDIGTSLVLTGVIPRI